MTTSPSRRLQRGLLAGAVGVGIMLVWLSFHLLTPLAATRSARRAVDLRMSLPAYDYEPWRLVPVQEGRIKPFDTICAETVRQVTGRSRIEHRDPLAVVLAWMLDGGDEDDRFTDWENYPFLLCDHHGLREAIYAHHVDKGETLTAAQRHGKHIAPADLRQSPGFDRLLGETARRRKELQGRAHLQLSTVHLKAEEVGRRLASFDAIRGKLSTRLHVNAIVGEQYLDLHAVAQTEESSPEAVLVRVERRSRRVPDPIRLIGLGGQSGSVWLSRGELAAVRQDPQKWRDLMEERRIDQPFPQEAIAALVAQFEDLRRTYRSGSAEQFDRASRTLLATLHEANPGASDYAESFARESLLQRAQPFFWAWILMLAAMAFLVIRMGLGWRAAYFLGLLVYAASLVVQGWGFWLRISIAGRAPVSNLYETVIFAAFMASIFALVLELIFRRTAIALTGAATATLGLILADQLPLALDPKISPMLPVLRTNYWLTVHVLTIVAGYAAGTLAWGLGNLTLGMLAFGKGTPEMLRTLSQFTYRAMQITVLLLAAGTFLGGWWAAEAWGRFWGWDPKEVGALIALVCYVIPLHARYLGWVRDFGLALSAVVCYAAIVLSWYVINFVIAAGLHSYGFSAGGGVWVLWATLINIECVLLATLLYQRHQSSSLLQSM